MVQASMMIEFPESASDAAVLLVHQMYTAINNGQMIVSDPTFEQGLDAWCKSARLIIADANLEAPDGN